MTIIERIQSLAKKTTGKDISGETIQEALENFEKAINTKPNPTQTKPYFKRQGYDGRKGYNKSKFED